MANSERDVSLFTEFSYIRYSIKDKLEGQISEYNKFVFINSGGTIMEGTIGQWSQQPGMKYVVGGKESWNFTDRGKIVIHPSI